MFSSSHSCWGHGWGLRMQKVGLGFLIIVKSCCQQLFQILYVLLYQPPNENATFNVVWRSQEKCRNIGFSNGFQVRPENIWKVCQNQFADQHETKQSRLRSIFANFYCQSIIWTPYPHFWLCRTREKFTSYSGPIIFDQPSKEIGNQMIKQRSAIVAFLISLKDNPPPP